MERMQETLGVAYIGYGTHCNLSHEPFLGQLELCEIVGIADRDEARLRAAQTARGLIDRPVFTENYHDLLTDDRVDAVVVTTDDSTHFAIAQEALAANKHVLVEKPAATTIEELARLPGLFDLAKAAQRRLWVCHPREFGNGPWLRAAELIGEPALMSEAFGVGPMGQLRELRYDCQYTVPTRQGLHTSFADDKLNHTIVSVTKALPGTLGFRNAVLHDNDLTAFDARFVTIPEDDKEEGVVVKASGRRSAHAENHGDSFHRDWIEGVFDEGVLRVEPSLGRIALTYGTKEKDPIEFDPDTLYDDMFRPFNTEFVRCALDPRRAEPLPTRTKLLATAAAILMQQPGFNGLITEDAVRQLAA